MIYKAAYNNVDTDISITVDEINPMAIKVKFTHFIDSMNNIEKDYECAIPFVADTKYGKIISLSLTKNARIIVDERFDDDFYYQSHVVDIIDKVCWFTIPANYNNINGLNNLEIYVKGGHE